MKQEDLKKEESNSAAKRNKAWGNFLLFLGIILLAANVCWYFFQQRQSATVKRHTDSLARILDTASAHFEFGYGEINSGLYKTMKSAGRDNNSLVYSVLNNEVNQLLASGHLDTTCTEIHGDNAFLKTYIARRKAHELKQREPGVICLIIKQTGKGKATRVKLDYNDLTINGAHDMYDPTDIAFGTNEGLTPEDRKKYYVVRKQLDLGEMDTGAAKLIPLYISNWFDRAKGEGDTNTWNVTGGPMWVPVTLSYLQQKSNSKQILLDEVLQRPISISR